MPPSCGRRSLRCFIALPLAGVLIVALYRFLRTQGVGTNAVLDAVHQGRELPILLIPAIFLATLLTHLAGGSAGREGAALQIGGDLGEHFGKMLRMDDKDCRLATLARHERAVLRAVRHAARGFFRAGGVGRIGVFFSPPLPPHPLALGPPPPLRFGLQPMRFAVFFPFWLLASVSSTFSALPSFTSSSLLACSPFLPFRAPPLRFLVRYRTEDRRAHAGRAACSRSAARWWSILFCEMLHRTEHLAERLVKNDYLRAFLGGCLVIALTLLAGCRDYNGAGGHVIAAALGGMAAKPEAFLLKIVFTRRYARLRLQGRRDLPTLCRLDLRLRGGSTARPARGLCRGARHHGPFLRHDELPLTSLLISVELFGADGLLCYAVVCAVSYVCSGYRGLYSSQTIFLLQAARGIHQRPHEVNKRHLPRQLQKMPREDFLWIMFSRWTGMIF